MIENAIRHSCEVQHLVVWAQTGLAAVQHLKHGIKCRQGGTKPTSNFSASLTQHPLALAACLFVAARCVSSLRSFSVADQSRTQTGLSLLAAGTFETQTKRTFSNADTAHAAPIHLCSRRSSHYFLFELCPTPFKFSELTIYLMCNKDKETEPGHGRLRAKIVGDYWENEGMGGLASSISRIARQ